MVTRSSTLQVVPQQTSYDRSLNFFQNLSGTYSESEVFCKKELAGRTMEFSFDVSQTPLIGRRLLLKPDLETNVSTQARISQPSNITGTPNSPRRSTSLSPADTAPLSGWKRPWMSQGRVRECLVNLLTTCGQRVGLPKSPSVSNQLKSIFLNAVWLSHPAIVIPNWDGMVLLNGNQSVSWRHPTYVGYDWPHPTCFSYGIHPGPSHRMAPDPHCLNVTEIRYRDINFKNDCESSKDFHNFLEISNILQNN